MFFRPLATLSCRFGRALAAMDRMAKAKLGLA